MDPRKAPVVTEPSCNQAFVQGFAEGRLIAAGASVLEYQVAYSFEGTRIREKRYREAEAECMYAEVAEHLAHGPGAVAEISVLTESPAELERVSD